ncbi:MAG: hypothetical protein ACTSRB_02560 [Candidatus Helarchaeota archaeon]
MDEKFKITRVPSLESNPDKDKKDPIIDKIQNKTTLEKEIKFERKKNVALQISLIAILTATGIGGSYALVFLPNVEILTLTIFITSFLFGMSVGCPMAAISSLIFHSFNPWGVAPLPTLVILLTLYVFVAVVGGLLGRIRKKNPDSEIKYSAWTVYKYAILGASLTLLYDFGSALSSVFFYPFQLITPNLIFFIYIAQIPYTIIHVVCNSLLFGLVAPQVIIRINKFIAK